MSATTLVGIIGHPVAHSLSPAMHNAAFAALGMRWRYEALEVHPRDLPAAIAGAREREMRGLNVTAPHKAAATLEMQRLEGAAQEIGLVNTIVFDEDEGAIGHSTDGEGFLNACADRGWAVDAEVRAVVVGAGGAGVSVAHALLECGARVALANRNAARLANAMGRLTRAKESRSAALPVAARLRGFPLADPALRRELEAVDLLVVAISAADLELHPELGLAPARLPRGARVIDLAYGKETPILAAARARGLEAANGLGMLLHQGALSFTLWTGREAPIAVMAGAIGYGQKVDRS
jgi:shikimate dehydrogenase